MEAVITTAVYLGSSNFNTVTNNWSMQLIKEWIMDLLDSHQAQIHTFYNNYVMASYLFHQGYNAQHGICHHQYLKNIIGGDILANIGQHLKRKWYWSMVSKKVLMVVVLRW